VPGIVGLGRAAEMAREWLAAGGAQELARRRDGLETGVLGGVSGVAVNGEGAPRVVNTTNLRFEAVDAEALLIALDMQGVAASFGAACMSGATEPSHVLTAMGLTHAEAKGSLRFSLSRVTMVEDVERAVEVIADCVGRVRRAR